MTRLGFREGGDLSEFNFPRFLKHLQEREGYRDDVYYDTLNKPTAGVGHLLSSKENEQYNIGDKVSSDTIKTWLKKDSERAVIEALGSVNFQLGTQWNKKFPSAYQALKDKNYSEAINQISTGKGKEGQSKWKEQTPVRVEDFKIAIEKLFK